MSRFIVNSFQVPNAVVDDMMATMSGNAFKCYVLIARKTTGWGKNSDRISVQQFMQHLGVKDKRTIFTATQELVELGLIEAIKTNGEITEFSLVLEPVTKNATGDKVCAEPVTKNATGDKVCAEPVTKNATGTSSKKCTSTKDNTKNTNTKYTPIVPAGDDCVKTIFEFWQKTMNHPDAELDEKRRKKIRARLREKLSLQELCAAISGASLDPWLMGKNPQNRRYDGIETILRDRAQVERLRDLASNESAKAIADGKYSAVTARNIQNLQRWAGTSDDMGAPF